MRDDLDELGAEVNDNQLELLGKFAGMLLERSRTANLIGPGERIRLWRRHILESISYSFLLDRDRDVIDIGSGNGFPGMVLAIMGFKMILLEPRRKRYLFLGWTSGEMGIENCVTVPLRLEDYSPDEEKSQFIARSVAPPAHLLSKIEKIAGSDSTLVCRQPEISGKRKIESHLELRCPPLDRAGFLVQYRV